MKTFCDILPFLIKRKNPNAGDALVVKAPDPVFHAYLDLVTEAFLYLRGAVFQSDMNRDELSDLADALHNIQGVLGDYGVWTDDAKYREIYLRGYDKRWAKQGFGLERFIDERVRYYSQ